MRRNLIIHFKELFWRLFYNFLGIFIVMTLFVEDPYQIVLYYWLQPLKSLNIPLIQGDISQLYSHIWTFSWLTALILITPSIIISFYLFIKPGLTQTESRSYFLKSLLIILLFGTWWCLIAITIQHLYNLALDTPQVLRLLNTHLISEIFKTFIIIPITLIILGILSYWCSRFVLWVIIVLTWGSLLDIWWEGPILLELCHLFYRIWTKQRSLIS